ncbi:GNAT family N-acetyltransferase [Streptomyces sp. NPDC060194]|uniref:GNAT family N-acetyltransferase n=1 Tax=Streptomyces sp. NPDC060194 TaxID=3347069 RepID=UPI0036547CF6
MLRTVHTADLEPAERAALRAFLEECFDGRFDAEDWDHTLGGLHVLAHDQGELVAHGSVVQRRVVHEGRAYRAGYVEGVAVRADRRRRGYGGRVMAALERIVDRAYDFGALSASDAGAPLYTGRGWSVWPGRLAALGPQGLVPLPEEEGTTYVRPLPGAGRGRLDFDWRDGDVL